jgi:hypothetical protein
MDTTDETNTTKIIEKTIIYRGNSVQFKYAFPAYLLFELLDEICLKTLSYYLIEYSGYRKMVYLNLDKWFINVMRTYYKDNRLYLLEKEFTYDQFIFYIRQICTNANIVFFHEKRHVDLHQKYRVYHTNVENAVRPSEVSTR